MQALLLEIGPDRYAVDIGAVTEVVPRVDVAPLPRGTAAARGLFNLRGDVLPLFDTAVLLGMEPGAPSDRVIVADSARGPAGLVTHERPDIVELDDRPARLLDVDELLERAAR